MRIVADEIARGQDITASHLIRGCSRLVDRFGAALCGHAHTWIAERVLNRQADDHAEVLDPTET
ncbi:hypothetical protein [Mesobacterium pallidum]|uniref:hypothetical protein n=1 Tax=Mesobacterium pallidum TaxID=2872037 RepID=UPI001EE38ED5|nr:hypothetical protein [Mesobacterium pallidum]